MIPINYWAVLGATVASIVLGSLWYGPLFGKLWMREVGMTEEKAKEAKAKGMASSYALMTVGSLVMSYVLAHAIIFASAYTATVGVPAGLMAGFWNWLGFVAPATMGTVLWEGRSWRLWSINNSYYLVTLMVMGVILAVWQ